ncbi:histidine-type phosphatase [Microvirga pudoricolor]|uniref:histidine-type phosphatase n=1 Tax=Microvirga pudoricolor TaxID=2778729 RepID=UPI00194F00F8|nr:histidine-type phosphatase [Microvirga pudoricolor]MBM6594394.1 histidine-type phosphatase [Microvirga pudoricolor]
MRSGWMFVAASGLACLSPTTPVRAEPFVDKAVIVSRHGVRPPTSQKALDPLSVDPWPSWPVPDGDLTPRGATAATLMGGFYRARLGESGLLAAGCPSAGEVFAWADKSERTKATANALLEGLYPGCGLKAGFNAKEAGPLFHPIASGVAPVDRAKAQAEMMLALGGSFEAAKERYADDFQRLAKVLRGPTPKACAKAKLQAGCSLVDLPWSIATVSKGRSVALKGPLDWAGTVGEVVRMEYANGFPLDRVAWGRVPDANAVKAILALHTAYYDASLRIPAIARPNASQLLNQVSLALRQDTPLAQPGGPPSSKLVLIVGHDTNIATMQAAMGVRWSLQGYPDNDTPPAGAYLFERLRDTATGSFSVRLSYLAQNLDQIRNLTPLTGASAGPETIALTLAGCPPAPAACGLSDFTKALAAGIDANAVAPVSYRPESPGPRN